ncbi:hypothetical protein [Neobacillus mesonae]|uniref:hypothetical protein n=1 Tax=Neobacillus mesonae TaxID=1193713 RepID=UPI002E1EC64E|nr:hypothetical protein [Neobacillus mesonae]
MPNLNRVRNGGFEQSTTTVAPFWTGTGTLETSISNDQLLGNNNADVDPGEFISQELLPLEVGEVYEFKAAIHFDVGAPTTGTYDINISGNTFRSFNGVNMASATNGYVYFIFDFTAKTANSTLTITNNTDAQSDIDVVSIYRK